MNGTLDGKEENCAGGRLDDKEEGREERGEERGREVGNEEGSAAVDAG